MTREQWEHLMFYLPSTMWGRAVVAGGFAADETKAKDVDLWVLASPGTTEHGIIKERLDIKHTPTGFVNYVPGNGVFYGGRYLVATIVQGLGERNVQLLTTDHPSSWDLVNSFDISTHAIAKYFTSGQCAVVVGTKWTPVTVQPRVLRFSTPIDTLARLEKICARYDLEANPADVDGLENNTFDTVEQHTIPLRTAA